MLEIDHISHSQIELWMNCPRKWEYRYVHRLRERSSDALFLGSTYHSVLEENFKAKMELGHDLDIDICLDMFSTYWDKGISKEWDMRWGKKSPDQVKDLGLTLIEKYIFEVAPNVIPMMVEQWLESYIDDVKFVLRMDLLDINNAVIDHKTAAREYAQADTDKNMQATATAYALGRSIVFYHHVAVKSANPHIQIVRSMRTSTDVGWWLEKVRAIIAHMQTGLAPPNENTWLCSPTYCDHYDECRKDLYTTIST